MHPCWTPKNPQKTRLWAFMRFVEEKAKQKFKNYQDLYLWSIEKSELFWQSINEFFDLNLQAKTIVSPHAHMLDARWFEGAFFNFAEKLLKRQDEHPAIISISEAGKRSSLSYKELGQEVNRLASALSQAGLKAGDRVAVILPNVSSTIIVMLATAALGAIFSSCSPDFGLDAALDRLSQIEPKFLFIGNGHQYAGKTYLAEEKIQALVKALPSLKSCIVCPILEQTAVAMSREENTRILSWDEFIQTHPFKHIEFEEFPFEHPLYILFSSGTTGKPKCIVHGAGGTLLQHLKELALHSDLGPEDRLCFYTTCGWMMWNWMVSVLALGSSLILYDGAPNYPKADRLFKVIEEEKVTAFGISAKFLSMLEKEGVEPGKEHSMESLKIILSTGSPLLPKQYDFVYQKIKSDLQLSSISGGTDIISCFALGNPLGPVYPGQLQCLGLGMAVAVFNPQGKSVISEQGELVCLKAFPSMPLYFWQDEEKIAYRKAYFSRFENVWAHGDFAEITPEHGLIIYGRCDAVLNPGGVRIGTAEIYRQIEKLPAIIDSVVIGQEWQDDVRIVLFVKLSPGHRLDDALKDSIRQKIRAQASPRHVPAKILEVSDIPRTFNGKLAEIAVRRVVHGQKIENLQALVNPESLKCFEDRDELKT